MISQEDKDFLEANRGHYNTAVNAGFIQDLGQDIKSKMVDIIKRYFAPDYLTNLWCGPCIIDMVKYLYTQYDAMPVIKKETFPKHDEPVKLQGNEATEMFVDEVKSITLTTETTTPIELGTVAATVKSEDIKVELKRTGKGKGGKHKNK